MIEIEEGEKKKPQKKGKEKNLPVTSIIVQPHPHPSRNRNHNISACAFFVHRSPASVYRSSRAVHLTSYSFLNSIRLDRMLRGLVLCLVLPPTAATRETSHRPEFALRSTRSLIKLLSLTRLRFSSPSRAAQGNLKVRPILSHFVPLNCLVCSTRVFECLRPMHLRYAACCASCIASCAIATRLLPYD